MIATDDVRSAFLNGGLLNGGLLNGGFARSDVSPVPAELPFFEGRPAAVLCPLFDEDGQAHVVLTRRSAGLRSHTGEVSFPGGRLDPGETAVAAALREAREEVGIDPASVDVVGQLSALATWSNPSAITPFVGLLPGRPVLLPNPHEVERAFTVPLVELCLSEVFHEELWELPDGTERAISFFELIGDTVWGATGRMLRELLDRVWAVRPVASGPGDRGGIVGIP